MTEIGERQEATVIESMNMRADTGSGLLLRDSHVSQWLSEGRHDPYQAARPTSIAINETSWHPVIAPYSFSYRSCAFCVTESVFDALDVATASEICCVINAGRSRPDHLLYHLLPGRKLLRPAEICPG